MSKPFENISREEYEQAKDRYIAGDPVVRICGEMKISVQALYRYLNSQSVKLRRSDESKPKTPKPLKYTPEQIRDWCNQYAAGKTGQQIAVETGVPLPTIWWYLEKMKMPRRRKMRNPEQTEARLRIKSKRNLLKKYGITIAQYEAMLAKQNGVCAICGKPPAGGKTSSSSLHVDHDHKTGENRGLLCNNCNTGIGKFFDDVELFRKAIKYLEPHV